MILGKAIGKSGKHVPWSSSPVEILDKFGVLLIGWPPVVMFRPLSSMQMWELTAVVGAIDYGGCHFEHSIKPVVRNFIKQPAISRKEGGRRDKGTCRGRQAHPAKPRTNGKRGKVFHPLPTCFGELEEDPIEEVD